MFCDLIKNLREKIDDDQIKKSNKPTRFINVEKLENWVRVKDVLSNRSKNFLLLSKYCSEKDLTPKINCFLNDLKNVSKDTLVLPISEHLRVNNTSIEQTLNNIVTLDFKNFETDKNFRVYILTYRMQSALKDLLKTDPRLQEYVWFLDLQEHDAEYTLTILPIKYSTKIKGNNLYGYKDYLAYWEDNPAKPIILHTDNAKYYKDNIYNDNVVVLTTAYDILKYHDFISVNIQKNYGTDVNWEKLLEDIEKHQSLLSYLIKHFSVYKFNQHELLSYWNRTITDYEKWLIWLWLKIEKCSPYLEYCISKTASWDVFIKEIINSIFDFDPNDSNYWPIYDERKAILKILGVQTLNQSFWDKWNTIKKGKGFYYLTDNTIKEKEEIIINCEIIQKSKEPELIFKKIWPDVLTYLYSSGTGYLDIDNYLLEYRKNKLSNCFPQDFIEKVNSIGIEKGIWWKLGMESRNKLIDDIYDGNSYVFYIDALGAEFISFINNVLDEEHSSIYHNSQIAYSEIPTITELNQDFIKNKSYEPRISDLDVLKHNGEYPSYIYKEFDIIRDVLKKAISKLETYEKIIITSDHGSSRGFALSKGITVKAENDVKGERDGRYCIDNTTTYESRFPCCIDKGEYHVFANYDRFSVSGTTKNENHGGAALEEVLVPVITLSNKPFKDSIKIIDFDNIAKILLGKAHISFKLDKEVVSLTAVVFDKRYICVKENERWYFDADIETQKDYIAQIYSDKLIGEFKYSVQKGIKTIQDF